MRWFLSDVQMKSSISTQSKILLCRSKRLFDQVVFTIINDVSHHAGQILLYYLNSIWKTKQSWLKKIPSQLARVAYLRVFIWRIFIFLRLDPWKIKWEPTQVGWLTSHMNTLYFYKSFITKVRSHLGELARLTGSANLHMNSS